MRAPRRGTAPAKWGEPTLDPFASTSDDNTGGILPPGWMWTTLGNLIERIEAGKNVAAIGRPPEGDEVGIVKVSAVTWGEFDELASKTLPPGSPYDEANLIEPGDFLISRANTLELVGAPVIVRGCQRRLVLSDKVLRLRFRLPVERWVELYLKSHFGRTQIEGYAQGAQLSMRNLSQENLRRIRVPLPPATEMHRVVATVGGLLADLNEAEAALARAREGLTAYRTSLLHAAFTGRLTPQDPADEHATDLFSRLRTPSLPLAGGGRGGGSIPQPGTLGTSSRPGPRRP